MTFHLSDAKAARVLEMMALTVNSLNLHRVKRAVDTALNAPDEDLDTLREVRAAMYKTATSLGFTLKQADIDALFQSAEDAVKKVARRRFPFYVSGPGYSGIDRRSQQERRQFNDRRGR